MNLRRGFNASEADILQLLANQGMSNTDLASAIFLSEKTIKVHIASLFNKLGCMSRGECIVWAWQNCEVVMVEGKRTVVVEGSRIQVVPDESEEGVA